MRVLRISHASLTPALRERERALVRRHADVELEVVTTSRWREAEVVVNAVGDDLFPVTTSPPLFSEHIQLFAYDPRPIIAALRRHQPHLIDVNHEPYSVACAEVLTLCKWYTPQAAIVLQPCQNIFHRYPPPFNWLERRALRRAAAAHVCSETVRELLRAKGFRKPVEIIPFGVDVRSFQFREPSCEPKEALTIGFVGRLLPAKGLTILAGALAQLRSEKWNLLIVGDGPERQNFESALSANGLLARTRFTGAISFDQVPDLFQKMDMLVLPTQTTARIREQFGRVLVEAMASGVPVIGSTCGAIPEVIDRVGLVTPEGDVGALAEAIRKLLANRALRAEFARAGKVRAEQRYSWDRVADKTYEFFQEVLTANAAPSSSIEQTLEFAS
jgi:glycosyltransferase involved in cell wall biosynthesis